MDSSIDKYAIIVAAGKGERFGSELPKQFHRIGGKPILYYSIEAFYDALPDIKIVLVLNKKHQLDLEQEFTKKIHAGKMVLTEGGTTRYHSVQNGLKHVAGNSVVFVHDGARPLISKHLILHCYENALVNGSAVPAVSVTESIRMISGAGTVPVDRTTLRIVQTPQTFRAEVLLPAFGQDYNETFTDEATVVESYGTNIHLVEGEKINIKVTLPEDIFMASSLLEKNHKHNFH